ncbi:ferritin-like domain-containing protein [Streptomyces stramineus]
MGGETSFSSWALMWGAEEARHSLVQARCLDRLGVKVRSKHALYKREPYPIGDTRAGTLMMNIISECRAAELYKALAADTTEPVVKRVWKLLGRDESRHARAFYVFTQELCDGSRAGKVAALKMAYVWLADRSEGLKHPVPLLPALLLRPGHPADRSGGGGGHGRRRREGPVDGAAAGRGRQHRVLAGHQAEAPHTHLAPRRPGTAGRFRRGSTIGYQNTAPSGGGRRVLAVPVLLVDPAHDPADVRSTPCPIR